MEQSDLTGVDFLDLGGGDGGSLNVGRTRFGGKQGLGIDFDEAKVAAARHAGEAVVHGDASRLNLHPNSVRFVTMMDFLEHLPSLEDVERTIGCAANVASDFLYIFHPSFDGEAYLRQLGLRQYWWHWSGHKSHVRVSDYCMMFDRLGIAQYMIRYVEPIWDSGHPSILSLGEARNQHAFDPEVHAERPSVKFEQPVFRAQEIFAALKGFDPAEWKQLTRSL